MGGINLVGWLSGFRTQIGSVANSRYATFVRRLGEAAARGGGECGPCPDFASYTLAFALQLRKNHGSRGVRISGSNAGYTMFRGSVKGTGYPLHSPVSPSLPLPCVTVCHYISAGVYLPVQVEEDGVVEGKDISIAYLN